MNDSSKYIIIQIHIFLLCGHLAFTADVRISTSFLEATYGNTVDMHWKIILDTGQTINSFTVNLKSRPEDSIIFGSANYQNIANKGKELFGNRLSAVYDKTTSTYRVSLKNIQYNETLSFQLTTTLSNPLFGKQTTIEIKDVKGSPRICGKSLKSIYTVSDTAVLTVTQDICGHPKPFVKWKLEKDNTFSDSFSSLLMSNTSRKYRYSFATRNIIRSDCGEKIMFNARNKFGNFNGSSTIYISFKPSKITLTTSYRYNASCVYLTWHKEDTGNCLLTYHLKFDDKDDVYSTFNTNFNLCHSSCAASASVWASYKGNAGYKNSINLRSIPSRPDTTIMPSSRTTTRGKATQSPDHCQYASENAFGITTIVITIVTTIVIGVIFNIVIFVILKHKGFIIFIKNPKKRLQHTKRRNDDNYEVTQITSSHYADLNVKSV
ncbi:uncharacterized protein LOC130635917 [Hydractinia symbiolongicarpus]|uniref:uncharacterized protein LOC130635917 n=1 Tax=Hydractinia symbiolongicarpus TaxID=13093 RepID=UPI00254E4C9A|nr:uncharacterized protein LOC130635917 [Hydractinia symbiolongicarpus]